MRQLSLLVTVTMLVVLPRVAVAQPWADAIRQRDYQKAADLLHTIASDPDAVMPPDPEPMRQLAILYAEGLGVPPDPVLACTLATLGYSGAVQRYHEGSEQASRAAALEAKYCGDLTPDRRNVAGQLMGCLTFGLEEQELDLGRHRVRVGRQGIALVDTDGSEMQPLECARQFGKVRVTTVAPPSNRAPGVGPRHFLELFYWLDRRQNASTDQVLMWSVIEVRGKNLETISTEPLLAAPDAKWKRPALPPEIESGLTFEMIRSGNVRWRFAGALPQRGWLLLPEDPEDRR